VIQMKIGIISDTHDQIDRIKKAIAIFKKEKVVLVYHLGDFCSPFTLYFYKDLPCSVKAVFGNNDGDISRLSSVKPGNMEFFDSFYTDEQNSKKIAVTHGVNENMVAALFESGKYDIILRGHTHVAEIKKSDKTILINPGSLVGPIDNFRNCTKPSIAIYDFEKDAAKIIQI
jgi:putative phosphoesterase